MSVIIKYDSYSAHPYVFVTSFSTSYTSSESISTTAFMQVFNINHDFYSISMNCYWLPDSVPLSPLRAQSLFTDAGYCLSGSPVSYLPSQPNSFKNQKSYSTRLLHRLDRRSCHRFPQVYTRRGFRYQVSLPCL